MLANMFTWWSSATIGTLFTIGRLGKFVGSDEFGNKYYEARDTRESYGDKKRRFVIYKGYADASKIPPDWHGWMHYIYDTPPSETPLPRKAWEQPHLPNMSGTPLAQYPKGSLNAQTDRQKTDRQKTTGDYEAWKP